MSPPSSPNPLGEIQRARLSAGGQVVVLDFNPKRLSITRRSMWQAVPVRDPNNGPPHLSGGSGSGAGTGGGAVTSQVAAGFGRSSYRGSQPGSLRVTALFDATFDPASQISSSIGRLESWTHIPRESADHQPPTVTFAWGSILFVGYLNSLAVNYLSFRSDGVPLAAEADLTITEEPAPPGSTNPSSGGIPGRRTHTMAAGDSLQSIANGEYGNPNRWRAIATANGIDDPLRVAVGTELLIPASSETGS